MKAEDIKTIGVCGAGTMGAGIAQQASVSGYTVRVLDVDDAAWARGLAIITGGLDRMLAKEKITQADKDAILGRISYSTDASAFADVDYVIEAVFEDLEVKRELFAKLEGVCRPEVVFATNTSSISITEIAAASSRPDRVVGMHFFNPVPVMKLVEIIPALQTATGSVELATAVTKGLGKTAVPCKDTPGFVVNRVLIPMLIDAARVFESGVASAEDIDTAMKLGAGLPMGPLELMDFTGVDIAYHVGNVLFEYTKEQRFSPPTIMRKMVKAGHLGRKTGKGFYEYEQKS
ncbi:MAG: 3-hydroxyacyl-CoA dehydrogenase family protein [Thermoleophilia bacterium]